MNRKLLCTTLLLLPLPLLAADNCPHARPIDLTLDLAGIETLRFVTNAHDLAVNGGGSGTVSGRACASSAALLDQLQIVQRRDGNTLTVELQRNAPRSSLTWGKSRADITATAAIPARLPVELVVGSGDAAVDGVARLDAAIGAGDVAARNIPGPVQLKVGSGDVTLQDTGALTVSSIGSGDLIARNIRGALEIGAIGSGDARITGVAGPAHLGTLGSGDVTLVDIGGDVSAGSIGSGDLEVRNVRGDLRVEHVGSGDVRRSGVTGKVSVPRGH